MAQSTKIVRVTLDGSAVNATTDITSSGFGTPTAVILIASNANSTSNPAAATALALGFWDGTNQGTVVTYDNDGAGTTATRRYSNDAEIMAFLTTTGVVQQFTCAAVTDGIRLTCTLATSTASRYVTAILIKGTVAKLTTIATNNTQNGTAVSSSQGFAPAVVMFAGIGLTTADADTTSGRITFGMARTSDFAQRSVSQAAVQAVGTSQVSALFSSTRCAARLGVDAVACTFELTASDSTTFTVTTRDGTSGSIILYALAFDADVSFDMGTLTVPTSGNTTVTTTIAPESVLVVASNCTGTTIETADTPTECVSLGMSDGTSNYCHNMVDGDNLDVTNTQAQAFTDRVLDLKYEASGFTDLATATAASFGATSFSLNYSLNPATARLGWWLAFGNAGGAAKPVLFHAHYLSQGMR